MMDTLFGISPVTFWAILGLLFILSEFILPGLIVFFFGLSALTISAILLAVPLSLNLQLLIFTALAVVYLVVLRSRLTRVFRGFTGKDLDPARIDDDAVGETAVALDALTPGETGAVEFRGAPWKAETDAPVPAGDRVRITRQRNLVLYVEPLNANQGEHP